MCGACGRVAATDEWSSTLASRRARWEATRTVNVVLMRAAHPGRVDGGTGAWIVRSGTGRAVLADTITDLWRQLSILRPISVDALSSLTDSPESEVIRAVLAAGAHVCTEYEKDASEVAPTP